MTLDEYQALARTTVVYPDDKAVVYPVIGLLSEAGEVAGQLKRVYRDDAGVFTADRTDKMIDELADVLWYVANALSDLGCPLDVAAQRNLAKLANRRQRGVLKGEGDGR